MQAGSCIHTAGANTRVRRGFTLIELLVVVAIIGILSAIALLNMKNARTRAQVARVESDLRTIGQVLMSYRIDHDNFPPGERGVDGAMPAYLSGAVTSPIAYISSIMLMDGFPTMRPDQHQLLQSDYLRRYRYLNIEEHYSPEYVPPSKSADPNLHRVYHKQFGGYMITSNGPDLRFNAEGKEVGHQGLPYFCTRPYDPTNGTHSLGNMIRSERYMTTQQVYDFSNEP